MIRAILAAAALSLVLVSLTLPWLTINILGQFSFSPIDMVRAFLTRTEGQGNSSSPDITKASFSFVDSSISILVTAIGFLLAVLFLAIAMAFSGERRPALGLAGFCALVSGMAWIYCVESLKTHIAAATAGSGGLGQMLGNGILSATNIGIGTYLILTAGIISLVGFFLKQSLTKKDLVA